MTTSSRTTRATSLGRRCAGTATTLAIVLAVALSAVAAPRALGSDFTHDVSTHGVSTHGVSTHGAHQPGARRGG